MKRFLLITSVIILFYIFDEASISLFSLWIAMLWIGIGIVTLVLNWSKISLKNNKDWVYDIIILVLIFAFSFIKQTTPLNKVVLSVMFLEDLLLILL